MAANQDRVAELLGALRRRRYRRESLPRSELRALCNVVSNHPFAHAGDVTREVVGASPTGEAGLQCEFRDTSTRAGIALIALMTLAAYWPCLWGGFIWDDNSYVAYNSLLLDAAGLWRIWFEPTATPQYHPLVFSSYWIEYQIWGTSTFGYHLVNVVLHIANSLIFWLLLRRLQVPGALLASAIFALHPVHVESVAWITERKDVLSTFFYGLTMLRWLRFLRFEHERDWWIAVLLAACTLLSKTVLCTLPAAMALVALWQAPTKWRMWTLRLVPFFLMALPIAAVTVWREHAHGNPPLPYTWIERALIASRALWTHVGLLVWPVNLTIVYAAWTVSATDVRAYVFLLAAFGAFLALAALRPRHGSGPLVAASFFVVTLAPMIGFVDFNIMRYAFVADHFQYVAGAGLIALAAATAERWSLGWPRSLRRVSGMTIVGGLAFLTWQQSALYADADTIWRDNVAKNPQSWVGHTYLATELMRAGKLEDAAEYLRGAVVAMPENAEAHRTLAILLASIGRDEEALHYLRLSLEIDPANARTENSLAAVLMGLGRVEEAEAHFAAAVRIAPEYAEAWHGRGLAAAQLGKRTEAITYLREALRLRPDFPDARADLDAVFSRE